VTRPGKIFKETLMCGKDHQHPEIPASPPFRDRSSRAFCWESPSGVAMCEQ
jgi:hypothetical protein